MFEFIYAVYIDSNIDCFGGPTSLVFVLPELTDEISVTYTQTKNDTPVDMARVSADLLTDENITEFETAYSAVLTQYLGQYIRVYADNDAIIPAQSGFVEYYVNGDYIGQKFYSCGK